MKTTDCQEMGKTCFGEVSSDGIIKIAPVTDQQTSDETSASRTLPRAPRHPIRGRHQPLANRAANQNPPLDDRVTCLVRRNGHQRWVTHHQNGGNIFRR